MLRILALAAAAASAHAFVAPSAARVQGSARGSSASRPALRGARALRAVYEPALRIGHGFDIHRLGESVCVSWKTGWICAMHTHVLVVFYSTGRFGVASLLSVVCNNGHGRQGQLAASCRCHCRSFSH